MDGSTKNIPWHVAYQKVKPYVVKIITPQGSGTGFMFVITTDKKLLGIATAAHVLHYEHYWEQPIRIQHAESGKTIFLKHDERVINIDVSTDVASIIIQGNTLPLPPITAAPTGLEDLAFPKNTLPIIAEDRCLKIGVTVGWMGFPAIASNNLCFFSGSISGWVERKEGSYYFVDGVAINGVSGGPTFSIDIKSNQVQLIGLVSAYIPNQAMGVSSPGLCVVQDIFPLHETIKELKSLEDAKRRQTPAVPLPSPSSPLPSGEPTLLK